jgi:hypothetical protein
MKRLPREALEKALSDKMKRDIPAGLADVIADRIEVFSDIDALIEGGEMEYFFEAPSLDPAKLVWKNSTKEETLEHLSKLSELIGKGGDIMAYAEEKGKGNVLWPLRYALSGKDRSPDPFSLIKVLGKEESASRVSSAIASLK